MLRCPCCASPQNIVLDSRPTDQSVRRRRQCVKCGERWTTYEVTDGAFEALAGIDALLDGARAQITALSEAIDKLRSEGRLIRDDTGFRAYRPVQIGSYRFTAEDAPRGQKAAQAKHEARRQARQASEAAQ